MSIHKFEVELEIEATDADDAEDILINMLDSELAVAGWHSVPRG